MRSCQMTSQVRPERFITQKHWLVTYIRPGSDPGSGIQEVIAAPGMRTNHLLSGPLSRGHQEAMNVVGHYCKERAVLFTCLLVGGLFSPDKIFHVTYVSDHEVASQGASRGEDGTFPHYLQIAYPSRGSTEYNSFQNPRATDSTNCAHALVAHLATWFGLYTAPGNEETMNTHRVTPATYESSCPPAGGRHAIYDCILHNIRPSSSRS
ncbi:hypothetical protein J6590_062341 [Homalodisca vitripennis]|nr:hypothetical protein J6590_062341 [Homalodisca vitripennis]